ncbi:MAG: hypothetical protein LBV63_02630, partial [Candidatus Methanoplasma sp.]|nr:hypothetical protein [Candidatus Methanoplasma sp.]
VTPASGNGNNNNNNNGNNNNHDREDRPRRDRDHDQRRDRDRKKENRVRDADSDDNRKNNREGGRFNQENAERFKKKPRDVREEEPQAADEHTEPEDQPSEPKPVRERQERPERTERERPERQERQEKERPEKTERSDEKPTRSLRGKKDRNTKTLSPEQEAFRDILLDMSSTHNAKLLAADNSIVREIAVKNLVNSLKEDSGDIVSIIFDGVISQRILDVSVEKGIRTIVGTRKGNITKLPADTIIWTKEDLY